VHHTLLTPQRHPIRFTQQSQKVQLPLPQDLIRKCQKSAIHAPRRIFAVCRLCLQTPHGLPRMLRRTLPLLHLHRSPDRHVGRIRIRHRLHIRHLLTAAGIHSQVQQYIIRC
jgi:hypothetical protein